MGSFWLAGYLIIVIPPYTTLTLQFISGNELSRLRCACAQSGLNDSLVHARCITWQISLHLQLRQLPPDMPPVRLPSVQFYYARPGSADYFSASSVFQLDSCSRLSSCRISFASLSTVFCSSAALMTAFTLISVPLALYVLLPAV